MEKKISVLVVDDSLIFRHAIVDALKNQDNIVIAGSVRNGKKAVEFINENGSPDIVTLDVEMPEMGGLETLAEIQKINAANTQKEMGVIMVSALTEAGAKVTIEALEAGAFDFITKPKGANETESIDTLRKSLLPKIMNFVSRKKTVVNVKPEPVQKAAVKEATRATVEPQKKGANAIQAIVIGISTGGPKSLCQMLPDLCQKTKLPILIVQHMPPTFTLSLAESLDKKCSHHVVEAKNGDTVENGTVYIAPGGRHMIVRRDNIDKVTIGLTDQVPENGCRPSADVLFRTASTVYGDKVVAVVMTGMGNDGSRSLRMLKNNRAYIIAQDEATSVVWGMPGSAVETGHVDKIAPLMEIPDAICSVL